MTDKGEPKAHCAGSPLNITPEIIPIRLRCCNIGKIVAGVEVRIK